MLDCQEVADCIENSDAVKEALAAFNNQWLNENTPQTMTTDRAGTDLGAGFNPTCDWDVYWSICVNTVERVNETVTDLLERLADETTVIGIAGVVAELPGLENVGLATITELADLLLNLPLAAYAADYDATWRDTLACTLFCLGRDNCELTIETIFSVINARITADVPALEPPLHLWNFVDWVLAFSSWVVELSTVNKADLAFYIVFGGLRFGDIIIGQLDGFRILQVAAMLASDEPNNDWETLCTDCVWSHEWDFTVDDGGWQSSTIAGQGGTWNSTDGWYFTSTASGGSLRIWKPYTGALGGLITAWEMDVVIPQQGSTARRVGFDSQDLDGTPSTQMVINNSATTGTHTYTGSVTFSPVNAGMAMFNNHFLVTNGQKYKCLRIKLSGTGNDPFA